MPSYNIKHTTRYTYASEVIDCVNQIMLYPIEDDRLEVVHHDIAISHDSSVTPDTPINIYTDYFGNKVGVFSVLQPHTVLVIESSKDVVTHPIQFPMDEQSAEEQWQHLQSLHHDPEFIDFLCEECSSSQDMRATLEQLVNRSEKPLKNALVLSEYVYDNFHYQQGVTNIETPAEEIWQMKAGVCQDFAHILLAMIRMVGIPARYVSGYVCPQKEGVRGSGATHAWVEAYIPFYGWLGLDPTNNCIVNDGHVRMAIGRNFPDCTPVKGTYKGTGSHRLDVSVHIESGEPEIQAELPQEPNYTYEVKDPTPPINSYRRYQEMQMQMQQQ
ncbi:transglutaminase family protein [Hymenobacter sp. HSC-4F20]|uniref:transglutaminase family protein n=1 Tax=Hymenobacter sp. HSC-4F20 TaxID=2864135 RepID=UPI001C7389D6|nr:transglutaminase family protein [Hymenobacter sp. HSC-4F20]MBX0291174.1 transglutaminase family protein [Hymenobacter sp. HSC-4F20]